MHFNLERSYWPLQNPDGGVRSGTRLAFGEGPARVVLALALALALAQVRVARASGLPLGGVFKVCSRSDPQLEQCILDSLNVAKDKLANGVPELGIPSLEPLRGKQLDMQEGEEDFNMQLTFDNYSWTGLSDFVATKARLQFSPPYLELATTHKNATVSGPYKFGGSLLTLRINGNGDSFVNWGFHSTLRLRLEEEKRGGEVFWRIAEFSWQQDIFHFHCLFKNLFRGNKRLGQYANQFINRNWKPAYAVYAPVIDRPLGAAIREQVLEPFLARVPVSRLFAP